MAQILIRVESAESKSDWYEVDHEPDIDCMKRARVFIVILAVVGYDAVKYLSGEL
ncbi:MAG: hypothetical protein GQF41_2914 [Candidatus Rifleibacterium amylolyticum]|nr:MAG: hypothetical protein GQF41_2914 [Candidatus Rifleibacterium amylolyticum]